MNARDLKSRGRAHLLLAACLAAVLLPLACADIPTRPLRLVHVTGSVVDRDGVPAPDVELFFWALESFSVSGGYRPWTETDSTGSFALELYDGRYEVSLLAPPNRGLPSRRALETRIDPLHARLDYRYDGYWVRGRILDPSGSPLADGTLSASRDLDEGYEYYSARFDSGGFSLLLPAGTFDVSARPADWSGFPSASRRGIQVQADTTWEISLTGDLLAGTVRDRLGAPIADAYLAAQGQVFCSGRTDGSGAYGLYLPPGVYALALRPSPGLQGVDPPDLPYLTMSGPSTFDITVTGVSWTGAVRLSTTGDPVPGALVSVWRIGSYDPYPVDTTDASGAFRFLVQPGRGYSIRAQSTTGTFAEKWISPVSAGNDSAFDLLVDPPGTPAGRRPDP